jgi:hypothetical protein
MSRWNHRFQTVCTVVSRIEISYNTWFWHSFDGISCTISHMSSRYYTNLRLGAYGRHLWSQNRGPILEIWSAHAVIFYSKCASRQYLRYPQFVPFPWHGAWQNTVFQHLPPDALALDGLLCSKVPPNSVTFNNVVPKSTQMTSSTWSDNKNI